jgi:hypothetical protein
MKLADVLPLEIDAKALAKATALSARQIRKLRAGGREVPDIDIDPEKVESLLAARVERTKVDVAREAWYIAEAELLELLQETDRKERAAASVCGGHTAELLELYQQFDAQIQAALKAKSVAARAAQALEIKAIWLPNADEIGKLMNAHSRRMRELVNSALPPSELMKQRISQKLST